MINKIKELPKQETLEEAKLKFCNDLINWQGSSREDLKLGWDACAKWMQERYSKMDIINITCDTIDYEMRKYAIEQFKKK